MSIWISLALVLANTLLPLALRWLEDLIRNAGFELARTESGQQVTLSMEARIDKIFDIVESKMSRLGLWWYGRMLKKCRQIMKNHALEVANKVVKSRDLPDQAPEPVMLTESELRDIEN